MIEIFRQKELEASEVKQMMQEYNELENENQKYYQCENLAECRCLINAFTSFENFKKSRNYYPLDMIKS